MLDFPPWTQDIGRDVYLTRDSETRTPFHVLVHLDSTSAFTREHSAPAFSLCSLPVELQYRILTFCSPAVLFRLMHVSSMLRKEAAKLFWKDTDIYFLIEASWLLDGPFPGRTYWDMAFLPHVEHLEVEYPDLTNVMMYRQPFGPCLDVQQDRVTIFWENLQLRFPRVKRVLFNHNAARRDYEEKVMPPSVPLALQLLLHACPSNIEASALVLEGRTPASDASVTDTSTWKRSRSIYRFTPDSGTWQTSIPNSNHRTVFMPAKQFKGPVGEFRKIPYIWHYRIVLLRQGLWPLMVEARDRHYFNSRQHQPFSCMLLDCNAYFDKPGLWIVHVREVHTTLSEDTLLGVLPPCLRNHFAKRIYELESKTEALKDEYRRLRAMWLTDDEKGQKEVERSWIQQLENDEAWDMGDSVEDNERWPDFGFEV